MQFIDKNIAILGLGQEAVDFIAWLKKTSKNYSLTIFDQKQKSEIEPKLKGLKNVNFSLGENYLKKGLNNFDIIFRSPGFHALNPVLLQAKDAGVPITSAIKLFFDLCPAKIIGVTGTKGKGTTTTLIGDILKESGKKCYVAGNIGKPVLTLLQNLKSSDYVCLELSSFQLQDLEVSPHIAVVLNITSEHLDVHTSTQEYRQAKENILKYQTQNDFAVTNADYEYSNSLSEVTKAKSFFFSRRKKVKGSFVERQNIYLNLKESILIGPTNDLLLRGTHNWENVTAAIAAASLTGAATKAIKKAVFNFKGLEHRLELVGDLNGVKYYNDSFSTTPETAIAAINAFDEPITIILGGSDKGSDFTALGQQIVNTRNIKNIVLIGQMAGVIKKVINKAGKYYGKIIYKPRNMTKIINLIRQKTDKGDVVILSPACASFDMFDNYKDRGNQFKEVVRSLV